MNRMILLLASTLVLLAMPLVVAGDGSGGLPARHDMTGKEFGAAISALAQSEPGAMADFVAAHCPDGNLTGQEAPQDPRGLPALHGMTGKEFGAAISALARSEPGAMADFIADHCPDGNLTGQGAPEDPQGLPALHGMTGKEFGAAISALAQSEPGAMADFIADHCPDSDVTGEGAPDLPEGIPPVPELPQRPEIPGPPARPDPPGRGR